MAVQNFLMHAVSPIWFVFFLELLVYGFRHWNMKILWKFKVIWAKFNVKLEIYNGSYNDLLQNVVWVRQILVHRVILSKMNLIPMKELLFVKELVTFSMPEKCPNEEIFLVRIFLCLDWIRRFTPWISVFSLNKGKHRPGKIPYLDTFHADYANICRWLLQRILLQNFSNLLSTEMPRRFVSKYYCVSGINIKLVFSKR